MTGDVESTCGVIGHPAVSHDCTRAETELQAKLGRAWSPEARAYVERDIIRP